MAETGAAMKPVDPPADPEPTEDDILKELESQIGQDGSSAQDPTSKPAAAGATTASTWLPSISNYMFSVTAEEKEALNKGTEDIKRELGKVGEEFQNSIQTIGGLLGGAMGIPGAKSPLVGSISERFEAYFPDMKGVEVVEGYACNLVQRFRCYHNAVLPEKSFNFGGLLFLTAKSCAFYVLSDLNGFGRKNFPVVVNMVDTDKVQKVGEPSTLKITTKKQVSYIFSDFTTEVDMDNAVTTIERLAAAEAGAAATSS